MYCAQFAVELADLFNAESENPCDGKHRESCGNGEQDRQEPACARCHRHRYQHTEVENTACRAESHREQDTEQQGSSTTFPDETLTVATETELRQIELIPEQHEQSDKQEQWTDKQLSPFTYCFLNAEHACVLFQY